MDFLTLCIEYNSHIHVQSNLNKIIPFFSIVNIFPLFLFWFIWLFFLELQCYVLGETFITPLCLQLIMHISFLATLLSNMFYLFPFCNILFSSFQVIRFTIPSLCFFSISSFTWLLLLDLKHFVFLVINILGLQFLCVYILLCPFCSLLHCCSTCLICFQSSSTPILLETLFSPLLCTMG
jgi:hypothetical protein